MRLASNRSGGLRSLFVAAAVAIAGALTSAPAHADPQVTYHTTKVQGVNVFYRDAGPKDAPVILLLHGFPTSSHMFRDLIPLLSDEFRVIAPDYPGFGNSDMPSRDRFAYTFDNFAGIVDDLTEQLGIERYSIYMMDYGAPVGFRLAVANPDKVQTLIVQNGNAYDEGLREFWDPIKAYWKTGAQPERDALRGLLTREATIWQYTHGTRNPGAISPDNWNIDQPLLDRPGNAEIQLDLFYDYRTNVGLYPQWQAYFRERQPPMLITWGVNDHIFPGEGATPYARDLQNVETHLLDAGHFILADNAELVAALMTDFLRRNLSTSP